VSVVVVESSVVVVVGASVVVVVGASVVVVVVGASVVVVVVGGSVVVVVVGGGLLVVVVVGGGDVVVVVAGGEVVVVVVGNGKGSGNSWIVGPGFVVVVEGLVETPVVLVELPLVCAPDFPDLVVGDVVEREPVDVDDFDDLFDDLFDGLVKITILGTAVVGVVVVGPAALVAAVVGVTELAGCVTGGFEATVVGTAARVGRLLDLNGPLRYRPTTRPVVTTTAATATISHLFHFSPPCSFGIW
jgi:hypothetical protein